MVSFFGIKLGGDKKKAQCACPRRENANTQLTLAQKEPGQTTAAAMESN